MKLSDKVGDSSHSSSSLLSPYSDAATDKRRAFDLLEADDVDLCREMLTVIDILECHTGRHTRRGFPGEVKPLTRLEMVYINPGNLLLHNGR